MKLVAFGLVLLGCLQSLTAPDLQVIALHEMRMMLTDSRGVLKDWNDNQVSPCYFNNVRCNQVGSIIGITLSSSGLSGVLSPSIATLTTLQQLLLDGNSITGGIPQELGNLSNLMTLKLGRNSLNGSIPESFGLLSDLQNLDLCQNMLIGNIPSSLSNLSSLNNINLAYNSLSGEIPEQLLQVSQYNYTGNHLKCGQHFISCNGGTSKTGGSSNSRLKVILGSIGGVVILIVSVVLFLLWWERMRHRPDIYIDVADIQVNELTLDWATRMRIALGAARGLEYLHEHCNPKIIHRDVKAANVLLNGNFEAVIGDFGLAKMTDMGKNTVTTGVRGTVGHIAPEYFKTGRPSVKTDIFGYGVMLLEIVTGEHAIFPNFLEGAGEVMLIDQVKIFMQEGRWEEIVDRNIDSAYDFQELVKIIQVALLCTHIDPCQRPAMSEVVHMLEGNIVPEDRWEEWQRAEVIRRQQYENKQHHKLFSFSEESLNIHEAVELSGGR